MTIATLPTPVVDAYPDVTTQAEMNTILADLVAKLNETIVQVNALAAPAVPDLSGYTTDGEFTAHKSSNDHTGYLVLDTAIAGKRCLLQWKDGTLAAGTAAITWTTAYTGGAVLAAWAINTMTSPSGAVAVPTGTVSTTGATVKGTGTDTFRAFVVGYL